MSNAFEPPKSAVSPTGLPRWVTRGAMVAVLLLGAALYAFILLVAPEEFRPMGLLGFVGCWTGLLLHSDVSERRVSWTVVSVVALVLGLLFFNLIPMVLLAVAYATRKKQVAHETNPDQFAFLDED